MLDKNGHDYSDSDHCLRCGAEIYESPAYFEPCKNDFHTHDENCKYLGSNMWNCGTIDND